MSVLFLIPLQENKNCLVDKKKNNNPSFYLTLFINTPSVALKSVFRRNSTNRREEDRDIEVNWSEEHLESGVEGEIIYEFSLSSDPKIYSHSLFLSGGKERKHAKITTLGENKCLTMAWRCGRICWEDISAIRFKLNLYKVEMVDLQISVKCLEHKNKVPQK